MRLWNVTRMDIRFQFKHGFYFLYAIFTLLYLLILFAIPEEFRSQAAALLIFSDPAMMGLYFMGGIVLLEKSQRVLDSLAVSPMRFREYLCAKVLSLAIISTLTGTVLTVAVAPESWPIKVLTVFFGSVFFSLMGLAASYYSDTLKDFLMLSVLIQLFTGIPGVLWIFSILPGWMIWHPGILIMEGICGKGLILPFLVIWSIAAFIVVYKMTSHKLSNSGGVKL